MRSLFRDMKYQELLAPYHKWALAAFAACIFGTIGVSLMAAPGIPGVFGSGLAAVMMAIALVDAHYFIIPDMLVLSALGWGILRTLIASSETFLVDSANSILRGLILALAFWGLRRAYKWFRGHDGIGLGDVKLAAVAGLWLSWLAATCAVEIAALAALLTIGFLAFRGKVITRTTRMPFGCFFAPAIWLAWLLDFSVFHSTF